MKKAAPAHENLERWLVSYSDFMTLIFAVFVVLYAFAMSKQSDAQALIKGIVQSFSETGFIPSVPGIISMPGPMAADLNQESVSAAQSAQDQISSPTEGGGGLMDFGVNATSSSINDSSDNNQELKVEGDLVESEVEKSTAGKQVRDYQTDDFPDQVKGQGGYSQGSHQDSINDGAAGPASVDMSGEGVEGFPFDSIKRSISESLSDLGVNRDVQIDEDLRWLTIHINSSLLFVSGSASILNDSKPVLRQIALAVSRINNYIRIRGYTDNQFVPNGIFNSSWDLSSARAISVLNELDKNGVDPRRMAIEGYGQYAPFFSNSTAVGQAQNRRVVIAISRYAIAPKPLEVLTKDENQIKTPEVNAGSSELELQRNADGSVDFSL